MRIWDSKFVRWVLVYFLAGSLTLVLFKSRLPSAISDFIVITVLISFFAIPAISLYQRQKAGSSIESNNAQQKLIKKTRVISRWIALGIVVVVLTLYFLALLPSGA